MSDKTFERKPLAQEISELDEAIFQLLARRGALTKKIKSARRGSGPGRSESETERLLWRTWEQGAAQYGPDAKLWRQLFTVVQSLAFKPREDGRGAIGFVLAPRRAPVDIAIPGPGSLRQTRLWASLATQADQPFSLPGVLVNDHLMECITAFDQVGAKLYRDETGLRSREGGALDFNDKVVFAGDDPLNLFMLLFLALTEPCRVKFTGGSSLKLLHLRPLEGLMTQLGARLTSVIPRTSGLPARLEASGVLPDEVLVPAGTPADAVLALAAAAPSYPLGLALRFAEPAMADAVAEILPLFAQCGVDAVLADGTLRIAHAIPQLPRKAMVQIDPFLGAAMLALPRFTQPPTGKAGEPNRVRLKGQWPATAPEAKVALKLLQLARLNVSIDADGITAEADPEARGIQYPVALDTSAVPSYFPLSLALATALFETAPAKAAVVLSAPELPAETEEFLTRFGLASEPVEGGIRVTAATEAGERSHSPWMSPAARWTVAYALAAMCKPGQSLANPGGITEIMPGFWGFYNSLPNPSVVLTHHRQEEDVKEQQVKDDGDKPTKRRIRL
ncbi:MAG: hypothetical protein AB7E47_14405 [Desulfovibrionaceae bacterium]